MNREGLCLPTLAATAVAAWGLRTSHGGIPDAGTMSSAVDFRDALFEAQMDTLPAQHASRVQKGDFVFIPDGTEFSGSMGAALGAAPGGLVLVVREDTADGTAVLETIDGTCVARVQAPPDYTAYWPLLPLRTTWARGKWRQNSYDARRLLSAVAYSSADTPGYEITLDAFGRPATVADDAGNVNLYAYDGNSMLTNETATTASATAVLERGVDQYGRPASTSLSINGAFKGRAVYSYDGYDRIAGIAFTNGYGRGIRVSYTNFAGHSLGRAATLPSGDVFSRSLTRDGYRSYRVTGSVEAFNGAEVSRLMYGHDNLDRVTSRNADTFSYNERSEIAAATLSSNSYAYAYDSAGNQTTSTVDYAVTEYSANSLNQYTSILRSSAPLREPSYDLDGNLLSDGVFTYSWDAGNRLVAVYSNTVCAVSNAYDHMSRRVAKVTSTATHTFLYDGWNLVQETISTPQSTITNHFVWGKDLSGSLQGAGGVGGLLAVSIDGAYYLPCYDNNGNITAYVNEQGAVVAQYTYDAFGATIAQSGSHASHFPHRFSTKYHDPETGLYYYGRRFYDPVWGRWLNRDPLGDETFFRHHTADMRRSERIFWQKRSLLPAYLFVQNNAMTFCDPVGLDLSYSGCECCPGIDDAVRRVNEALGTDACKEWFETHGHDYSSGNPSRSIACHGNWKIACMLGFPAWTMPGMRIGVCNRKCEELGSVGLASILIHELAHHYCTIGPGREDCAISAQDACSDALID